MLAALHAPVKVVQDNVITAGHAQAGDIEDRRHVWAAWNLRAGGVNRRAEAVAEVGVARCAAETQRDGMRLFIRLVCAVALVAVAQARPFMVMVYNVENLHDVDGVAQFEDYQPARCSKAAAGRM